MSVIEPQPATLRTSIEAGYDKRLMLFSGRANPELAARIAGKLEVELGPVELRTFSNGEVYCRYQESIRGSDVFIVQPTCGNPDLNLTANYDGSRKHRTVVGRGVKTGVDTALVAPVSIGDGAYTGAGSVIATDVPEGALGIARAEQRNIEGYAERKDGEEDKKEDKSS